MVNEDIIIEILSRLPVKTLIRFKCISRFFCVLTKNSNFISKQQKNYSEENSLFMCREIPRLIKLFLDETLVDSSYENIAPHLPRNVDTIMGPYDGIFCIYDDKCLKVFLSNPATRENIILPKCDFGTSYIWMIDEFFNGNAAFELDAESNDYKLLLIATFSYSTSFAMYTRSSNFWSTSMIDKIRYDTLGRTATRLKRVYYWLVMQRLDNEDIYDDFSEDVPNDKVMILSFHMRDEVFQEIQIPCGEDAVWQNQGYLELYNNSLCLMIFDKKYSSFELWIMDDKSNWSKNLTIMPFIDTFILRGFRKNCELLVQSNNSKIFLCDVSTHEIKETGIEGSECYSFIYKESLVSLKQLEFDFLDFFEIPWHILHMSNEL